MNELNVFNFNQIALEAREESDLKESLLPFPSGSVPSQEIRRIWSDRFTSAGWVANFQIPNSRQSISYWKKGVGVCVQLGNTCRASTDLLKLETLYRLKKIGLGILVVPSNSYSRFLGSNYASFATACRDLTTFAPAVSVPLSVVEFDPPKPGEENGRPH